MDSCIIWDQVLVSMQLSSGFNTTKHLNEALGTSVLRNFGFVSQKFAEDCFGVSTLWVDHLTCKTRRSGGAKHSLYKGHILLSISAPSRTLTFRPKCLKYFWETDSKWNTLNEFFINLFLDLFNKHPNSTHFTPWGHKPTLLMLQSLSHWRFVLSQREL